MRLRDLPVKAKFDELELKELLNNFPEAAFLSKELRENYSGKFPPHTRYFSNGDKPLVAVMVKAGRAVFGCDSGNIELHRNEFVFFDDSVQHWWSFENCNLEILYYRLPSVDKREDVHGDYCLDNYF